MDDRLIYISVIRPLLMAVIWCFMISYYHNVVYISPMKEVHGPRKELSALWRCPEPMLIAGSICMCLYGVRQRIMGSQLAEMKK